MANSVGNERNAPKNAATPSHAIEAPQISLPKGGGAIKGIDEKFQVNAANGTAAFSVPLPLTPGRNGFTPALMLHYNSGVGNSLFGLGWNIDFPAIQRKTDKQLPRYRAGDEEDVFMFSGMEDLVPVLDKDNHWARFEKSIGNYTVTSYRPRIEGSFSKIERIIPAGKKYSYWKVTTKENVVTFFGIHDSHRITDPADHSRIFKWLPEISFDDKGNLLQFSFKEENFENVENSLHERNRLSHVTTPVNKHIKRVQYGTLKPFYPGSIVDPSNIDEIYNPQLPADTGYLFELVFDYGEHAHNLSTEKEPWKSRADAFSEYRAGFEIRTYRLCERVLMFHTFDELLTDHGAKTCLVKSLDLTYQHQAALSQQPLEVTYLQSIAQTSYVRDASTGNYSSKSLPPVDFTYQELSWNTTIKTITPENIINAPVGISNPYQWTDLYSEGISGILTEQADAWYYKSNLGNGEFTTAHVVTPKPSFSGISNGSLQLQDIEANGRKHAVLNTPELKGYFELGDDAAWQPFRAFEQMPNRDVHDPNAKYIDLNGDGMPDLIISEENAFTWYAASGTKGYEAAEFTAKPFDEEQGPALVFSDSTQSIFLADMSGDGMTDIVRIRNGEISYWPNLGYGKFGAKVSMSNPPVFDCPDLFNPSYIHLSDVSGTGATDILYLGHDHFKAWLNLSGNSWSAPCEIDPFPCTAQPNQISVIDLLGNGTSCIVWSSPLPSSTTTPMQYIDLMGGQKPHLLIRTINNLGAETSIAYASSTRFYLKDKRDGKPWVTLLPFPVHCVASVTVTDKWRKTVFSNTYSYHHGYFDGAEREFRGFGRVEQVDVESYGEFKQGNTTSPYITNDKTLYQPPIKTITWYHTGAFIDRERILSHFEHEYFPRWLEDFHPGLTVAFPENRLPEPDLEAEDLRASEWREALRACKGMMLRQEVMALDIDALEKANPEQRPVKLFSAICHNCHIHRLQPQAGNRYAVFLVAESEAITYQYELDIRQTALTATLSPDPRIVHTLNLQYDDHANILQSVAVVYPRRGKFENDAALADGLTDALGLIHQVQEETHLAYSETRHTKDFETKNSYRLRLPCEVQTYELTGIKPLSGLYFTLKEWRTFQLSSVHQKSGTPVPDIPYHQIPNKVTPEKRLVEHARTLFFAENLVDSLPFREHGRLGLTYEAYKLALTEALLEAIFKDTAGNNKLDQPIDSATTARDKLNSATDSGYVSGATLAARFASIPAAELSGQYWIRSGIAGFANDATQHFFLPEKYTDPFDNVTTLEYDGKYDLFVQSSTDALGNTTRVTQFDYRVLAPRGMQDINDNVSEVYFDKLGLPTIMAVKGKGTEGDNLSGLTDVIANPTPAALTAFFLAPAYDEAQARHWLGNATARHVYHFGEIEQTLPDGTTVTQWGQHPACACGIVREQHVSQLAPGVQSPIQAGFEYSDGLGAIVVKKIQAEPESAGEPIRWVANGKTILNNKGKPVKQYEPYFSTAGHRFEEPKEEGVTPVIYYDAVGRTVRTEMPDGSFSRVEFSPWHVRTFDQNDTVKETGNAWFAKMSAGTPEEQGAAQQAAQHAGTAALTVLDSLGREVISVAHNRVKDDAGVLQDEKYLTFTRLDAEGKPLWIRDARNNRVMQYILPPVPDNQANDPVAGFAPGYDIAGNLLFQHSMDAGDRWILNDAAGKPMLAWNSRGHTFRTDYDKLHRPRGAFVKGTAPLDTNRIIQHEKLIYGETPGNGLTEAQKTQLNLRGKLYQHHDTASITTTEAFDFKGNPLRSTRRLVSNYKTTPDWSLTPGLEAETFTSGTRYDALNRPVQIIAPHSNQAGTKLNIIRPGYNQANLLERVNVWLEQNAEPTTLLDPTTASLQAVAHIDYDAKGQRTRIEYNEANHAIVTQYTYDKDSFRLIRLLSMRPQQADAGKRTLQDLSYTYDPVGNITTIRDKAQQTVFFNNSIIEPSNAYVYDALYRLIRAEGREHAIQHNVQRDARNFEPVTSIPFPNSPEALQRYIEDYAYDPVGNILGLYHTGGTVQRWVRRYQYAGNSNRLLATRLPGESTNLPDYVTTPGYGARYTYDNHGNMTAMPHLPAMEWDFKDQLHAIQRQVVNDGIGEKTYYVYDASGQRVRKVTEKQNGSRKDERLYLGAFEIYRKYKGSAQAITLERETLHVMDDKQRIALVETRTRLQGTDPAPRQLVRLQLGNHLGSAAMELDNQAQVISYEEYHPYGTTAYESARSHAETPKRYRYTGKERDEETGFSYHGARYYAPWLARWTSCDPILFTDRVSVDGIKHSPKEKIKEAEHAERIDSQEQRIHPNLQKSESKQDEYLNTLTVARCCYEYARSTPAILVDLDGLTGTYAPITKERLDVISSRYKVGEGKVGEVNRQRAIGRWFQNMLLRSFGLTENGRPFPTMIRDLSTDGSRGFVVPDAVSSPRYWRSDSPTGMLRGLDRLSFYAGFGGITLPDSTFYEFKALKTGTVINLGDSETQIKGMIDAASQTAATRDPKSPTPSSIHLVTTAGVIVSPEVIAYATAKDVLVVHHVAEEYISNEGKTLGIRIGAGTPLNEVVVTRRGAVLETNAGQFVPLEHNPVRINLLTPRIPFR